MLYVISWLATTALLLASFYDSPEFTPYLAITVFIMFLWTDMYSSKINSDKGEKAAKNKFFNFISPPIELIVTARRRLNRSHSSDPTIPSYIGFTAQFILVQSAVIGAFYALMTRMYLFDIAGEVVMDLSNNTLYAMTMFFSSLLASSIILLEPNYQKSVGGRLTIIPMLYFLFFMFNHITVSFMNIILLAVVYVLTYFALDGLIRVKNGISTSFKSYMQEDEIKKGFILTSLLLTLFVTSCALDITDMNNELAPITHSHFELSSMSLVEDKYYRIEDEDYASSIPSFVNLAATNNTDDAITSQENVLLYVNSCRRLESEKDYLSAVFCITSKKASSHEMFKEQLEDVKVIAGVYDNLFNRDLPIETHRLRGNHDHMLEVALEHKEIWMTSREATYKLIEFAENGRYSSFWSLYLTGYSDNGTGNLLTSMMARNLYHLKLGTNDLSKEQNDKLKYSKPESYLETDLVHQILHPYK